MKKTRSATPAIDRLAGKIRQIDGPLESKCHVFTGAHTSQGKRYGVIGTGPDTIQYAHIVAYEAAYGALPVGPLADGSKRVECHHICENKSCCNPAHLQMLTSKEHRALHAELRREAKLAEQLRIEQKRLTAHMERHMTAMMNAGCLQTENSRQYIQ